MTSKISLLCSSHIIVAWLENVERGVSKRILRLGTAQNVFYFLSQFSCGQEARIATFRWELSTRASKIFALQTYSACSVRKTRNRSRPRTAI